MRTFLFLASFLAACSASKDADTGLADDTGTAGSGISAADQALADDLWTELQGYTAWTHPDGWTAEPVLSEAHSGAFVVTWYSPTLAAWDGTGMAPEGAIAVKEAFSDASDTEVNGLTVMKKIAGYDAAHNDWFWATFSASGTAGAAGKVSGCYGCHAGSTTDYLYAAPTAR